MGIKDLFNEKVTLKILSKKNLTDATADVESVDFLKRSLEQKDRFIPQVDFSKPENFARFGSAEKYYEESIKRVYQQYPYDGSLREKIEWELSSSFLDKHIFENEYPRTHGYALFSPSGWGSQVSAIGDYGATATASYEYIQVKGGPHKDAKNTKLTKIHPSDGGTANIYHVANERESNLKFDLQGKGATVEFWLQKDAFSPDETKKEVIFDLWNGVPSSSVDFGRLTIEVSGTTESESPFYVTAQSGTAGFFNQQVGSSIEGTGSLSTWKHYAFSFLSASAGITTRLYVNGDLNEETTLGTAGINEVAGTGSAASLIANLGSLRGSPSGSTFHAASGTLMQGWAKLSGSIDEFRFWKTQRSSQQIGRYWFTQVGAGTNTDTANTKLGVYYKFNEGITAVTATDLVVLDYSGRVSNGTWTGYSSESRSTGSAMILSTAASFEFKDPIIRTDHPTLSAYITSKKRDGRVHDHKNNSMIYYSIPSWIIEEDEESQHLRNLTQIISSYLDTLYLQIDSLSKIHHATYLSGNVSNSHKPLPFADRLATSYGLIVPEIFSDATVLEYIGNRDEFREYEEGLSFVKNFIYKNIYNNLSFIYKSKGTIKSLRNLIRCFGIDDELIKINLYANNYTYSLQENFTETSRRNSYADFNHPSRFGATVHQYSNSDNGNTVSFISGSVAENLEQGLAITFETEVLFPEKFHKGGVNFFDTTFITASLFGAHTADTSLSDTETTFASPDVANFQVTAVKREINSSDVKFQITGSAGGYFPLLTSNFFYDTYNNERWLLAVRLAPTKYPNVGLIHTGSTTDTFTINFYGVSVLYGDIKDEFELTETIPYSQGLEILSNPKRFFVGAHRQNLTGSTVLEQTDVKVGTCRIWYDYVSNDAIKMHAIDPFNHGTAHPYKNAHLFEDNLTQKSISEMETLALHWTFETITGSDSAGMFVVPDLSSGSTPQQDRYGWISNVINSQHSGRGYGFPTNSISSIDKDYIFAYKQQLPEVLTNEETVNIVRQDDLQFTREHRPQTFFFALEKSMYQEVSYEMLKMFSTIKDFNNLIGEPVNRYRQDYKDLTKLRELYFERIRNTPDFEKFVDFYKWFDDSLNQLLQQLIPASANTSDQIKTVVESHILERNKYWTKFPTLESKGTDPEGGLQGVNELLYDWQHAHAPISNVENQNCFWWNEKAEREGTITSGDSNVDSDRNQILDATLQVLNRKFATPHRFSVDQSHKLLAGGSFHQNKRHSLFKTEALPIGAGNSLTGTFNNYFKDCVDEFVPNKKTRVSLDVSGLSVLGGQAKGELVLPFSVYSSSANSSFAVATDKEITNLHVDSYGDLHEIPMQGVFTRQHVGGSTHRNIDVIDDFNKPSAVGRILFVHAALRDTDTFTLSDGTSTKTFEFDEQDTSFTADIRIKLTGDLDETVNSIATAINGSALTITAEASSPGGININVSLTNTTPGAVGNVPIIFTDGPGLNKVSVHEIVGMAGGGNPTIYDRPEAFRVKIDGSTLYVHGNDRDLDGNLNLDLPRASYFRDEFAKRPVNIRNIETSKFKSVLGNYQSIHEIVQTSNRRTNNRWFVEVANSEYQTTPVILLDSDSFSVGVTGTSPLGVTEYTKPSRGRAGHVITERFSAPGGPETAGDANGGPGLDALSAEYSLYNTMNYRNSLVRDAFDELSVRHCGQFGYDSLYGATDELVYDTHVSASASFHKINRNTFKRLEYSGAFDASTDPGDGTAFITASIRDNLFIQHSIPQSDMGYAWISASALSAPYGFATDARRTVTNAETITFLSASDFGSYELGGTLTWGKSTGDIYRTDFANINSNIYEPITSSENNLGWPLGTPLIHFTSPSSPQYRNSKLVPAFLLSLRIPQKDGLLFNALMLHRNGPYGYPTWKQIRTGEHPVARHQRRNNRIGVYQPGEPDLTLFGATGVRPPKSIAVVEPALSSRFKPLLHTLITEVILDNGSILSQSMILKHTYGNNLSYFANRELDRNLTRLDGRPLNNDVRQIYDDVTDMYIRSRVPEETNPIRDFVHLKYRETVYPREFNAFLSRTRSRTNYDVASVLKWRETRADRVSGSLTNVFNQEQTASLWLLDGRYTGTSFETTNGLRIDSGAGTAAMTGGLDGAGELLNSYVQFHNGTVGNVKPGPLYARREIHYQASTTNVYATGDAKWEAASQSGKKPFYDTYDEYSEEIKRVGKDFSIIPEFRISDHIEYYLNEQAGDFRADVPGQFQVEGAFLSSSAMTESLPDTTEDRKFYQVYSTSDFLKFFDVIEHDHKSNDKIGAAARIRLSCKAIKKFRPREGFYPAQRTQQLVSLFSSSKGPFICTSGLQASTRTILQPLFAPGILYNTIKSGIAVDYPVYTSPYDTLDITSGSGGIKYITDATLLPSVLTPRFDGFFDGGTEQTFTVLSSSFDARIPFETLIDLKALPANIHDNEPHVSASLNSTASLFVNTPSGMYSLAAHNFFAETANFYLKGKGMTSIISKPDSDRGVLSADLLSSITQERKEYVMDVYLTVQSGEEIIGAADQIPVPPEKSIVMYNSASAFGPYCNANWNDGYGPHPTTAIVDCSPFTPPYYNGYARVRLTYKPLAQEATFEELLAQITATYHRGGLANYATAPMAGSQLAVADAMQITASVNILDPKKCLIKNKFVEYDEGGNIKTIRDDADAGSMWVIATKFETPILNFKNATAASPNFGNAPTGMWHQYGEIPSADNEGLFLSIQDVPVNELDNPSHTGSLADLVGFGDSMQRKKRIGTLPEARTVYEAVVAVPFIEGHNNQPRFLPVSRESIFGAQVLLRGISQLTAGQHATALSMTAPSIVAMVRKMKKYVFPPKMDFLTYSGADGVDPFAMYIFEFDHTFSKQDMADMWQNLSPRIGTDFDTAEATIEHPILEKELLDSSDLDGGNSTGKLRWMVFKVKQKASKNYYEKTLSTSDDDRFNASPIVGSQDQVPDYSFNWPYDYFSLVELIKLDAEVTYVKKDPDD